MSRVVVNVSEAKAKLSKLIDMVYHGESVTIAKNNLPVVDLVPHSPQGRRTLGLARGRITVSDDFDAESDEINAMFYGQDRDHPA
jgi:prevent-host-death family protein